MMGYKFTINKYYKVKRTKSYPWPCSEYPKRKLTIFPSDVLTKSTDGTYMKHTGLGTFGHVIPGSDLIFVDTDANLVML